MNAPRVVRSSLLLAALLAPAFDAARAGPSIEGSWGLKATVEHLRGRLQQTESKNNVKCWTTFRRTEDMLAGVPLDPNAAHLRSQLVQKFARELWARGGELEDKAAKSVGRDALGDAYRQFLKIGVMVDEKSWDQAIRLGQAKGITLAGLDVADLERTAESWRTLLTVAQADSGAALKNLSPEAADYLADRVNLFAVSLLKVAAKLCLTSGAPRITKEILERADSMLHFREIYYHFSNIGAGLDKRLTLPQSLWYAEDKIASLEAVNRKPDAALHLKTLEDIAGMALEAEVPAHIDQKVLPELARMLWLKAQGLMPKDALLISGEVMQQAVDALFPSTADEEEHITYFPRSSRPEVLLAPWCDSFRDDATHWTTIRDLLAREVRVEARGASVLHTPPDPYALEELSEQLSNLPTLVLRLAAQAARSAGRGRAGPADVQRAVGDLKERSRQAQGLPQAPSPRRAVAGEDPFLQRKTPVFEDVTRSSGLGDLPLQALRQSLKDQYWRLKVSIKERIKVAYHKLRGRELPLRTWNTSPSVDKFADGAAVEDYDRDGRPDVFVGGKRGGLFRNLGAMRFENVSWKAGLAKALPTHPRGAAFGDYDNDGWPDMLVSPGRGWTMLYRNNGDGTFTDVTEKSGIRDRIQNVALWLDYDKDACLDLYLLNRGDMENGAIPFIGDATNAEPNQLYRGNCKGTFVDVTKEAGVGDTRWALAGAVLDYDNDGWQDLYVDNDIGKDVLYRNLGNGKFREVTEKAGVADYGAGMGVSVGDFNRDGWPDLYGTNIGMYSVRARYVRPNAKTPIATSVKLDQYFRIKQANRLYRNNKDGTFTNVIEDLMGPLQTGWGWNGYFFDFDNDGALDVHVSNGALPYNLFYHDERQKLIRQDLKTGRFSDVSSVSGADFAGNSRGGAYADFDGDGWLDMIAIGLHDPKLFRNALGSESKHRWLTVRLQGTASNRDSIGAKVEVKAGDRVQTDWLGGQGGGLSSQSGKELHFGLGDRAQADWVKVRWPSGREKLARDVQAGTRLLLAEPDGAELARKKGRDDRVR